MLDTERLAGGAGMRAAKQSDEAELRRLVMACLLWEDIAYADGTAVAARICELVPKVPAEVVAGIAKAARFEQKLRHVPLLLCREMARHESHKHVVADTTAAVINRPDEMAELLSMYWKSNGGKRIISKPLSKGIARAFTKFDEYQLAKWNRADAEVKLRDVLFLTYPRSQNQAQKDLWKRLAEGELVTPDTWEVGLSAAKTEAEKRAVWVRLIEEDNLGALAFVKNLRNMTEVGVPRATMLQAFRNIRPSMLLPIDFMRAAQHAPDWTREIEDLMSRCMQTYPKLPGWSILVVDVSGSMNATLSAKTDFTRLDAGGTMAVMASEMCESVTIYATAGRDMNRTHSTMKVRPMRGFGLAKEVTGMRSQVGHGGIFTRQCLEYIRTQERETPDRIIVFSDSQDCDNVDRTPKPFGRYNYIVDVSSHAKGVNFRGAWTAEISGWSTAFMNYIAAHETQMN